MPARATAMPGNKKAEFSCISRPGSVKKMTTANMMQPAIREKKISRTVLTACCGIEPLFPIRDLLSRAKESVNES